MKRWSAGGTLPKADLAMRRYYEGKYSDKKRHLSGRYQL